MRSICSTSAKYATAVSNSSAPRPSAPTPSRSSRRQWPSSTGIAASLDIPKETIAAILGHGGNTTTDIYIDFDERKKDIAMRRVIDYVNGPLP